MQGLKSFLIHRKEITFLVSQWIKYLHEENIYDLLHLMRLMCVYQPNMNEDLIKAFFISWYQSDAAFCTRLIFRNRYH